jgi:hypothetical protein
MMESIDVVIENRKGWFSKDKKRVIDDSEHRFIYKLYFRILGRDGFPKLNKIDIYFFAKFEQIDLPILLEELRNYRKQLDTNELEVPIESIGGGTELSEWELNFFKITNEERESITKLIEIVEENIGKPNTSIKFVGW